MKYRKLPVEIEAYTFDEFLEIGRKLCYDDLVGGYPWSFKINGYPVTHENNDLYLITTLEGTMKFSREDMLIIGVNGEIYPCKTVIFNKTYEIVR